MFLFAGALLISKEGRKMMIKTSQDETQVILTGMISLIIGLPVIILHNVWTADILGFITLIGWTTSLKGVVRIAFPSFVVNKMKKYTLINLLLDYLSYLNVINEFLNNNIKEGNKNMIILTSILLECRIT